MADTFIWSLSYMKQTFIFRECDVIVRLPLWLVGPSAFNQQAELSNPLHMGQGGEEKKMLVLKKKTSERFQEEQGSEADPITLLTTNYNFQKTPKICVVFFNSVLWDSHWHGYKRVVSERVWEGQNMLNTSVWKGESEVMHFCSHVCTRRK